MMLSAVIAKTWDKAIDCIPFLLMTKKDDGSLNIKLNYNRVLEQVIAAIIIGLIMGWVINDRLTSMEAKVDRIYSDVYSPTVVGKP